MTNLGQSIYISVLTWLLHLFYGVGFGSVSWKHLFLYWFQGRNLLVGDQNFKWGGNIKKREDQISRAESFFKFFINQNLHHILFLLFLFLQILH